MQAACTISSDSTLFAGVSIYSFPLKEESRKSSFLKIQLMYQLFVMSKFNSFLASGKFCNLLIIFTNSLEPDQDRQNVGPDLDPNCLTL